MDTPVWKRCTSALDIFAFVFRQHTFTARVAHSIESRLKGLERGHDEREDQASHRSMIAYHGRHYAAASLGSRHTVFACVPFFSRHGNLPILSLRYASSSSGRYPIDSLVKENDIVLLRRLGKDFQALTKPLRHGRKLQTHFGAIDESDIIGKAYLDDILSSTGHAVRIHAPTLSQYVTLTPRQVTPVYPDDANLIVSLLDIHVAPTLPGADTTGHTRLDILEAGTGHGSLTLHLARAVHAANPPFRAASAAAPAETEDLSEWKARREAVVHTVDRSAQFSSAAQKIVAGFRRGMYTGNVDFHVGNVTEFIEARMRESQSQCFSHIVLDLPDVQQHIVAAARALRDGGTLLVFCPSVTQVAQCVAAVREHHLPLSQNRVLELGTGVTGGKDWDVRAAKLRHSAHGRTKKPVDTNSDASIWHRARSFLAGLLDVEPVNDARHEAKPERWEMVCRPSVGHRVVGGGFVGVWRRKRTNDAEEEPTGAADGCSSKEATS